MKVLFTTIWLFCLAESRQNFEFHGSADIISEQYAVKVPLGLDEALVSTKILGVFTQAQFYLKRRLEAGIISSTSKSGSAKNPDGAIVPVFEGQGQHYKREFLSEADIQDIDLNNLVPFQSLFRKLKSIAKQFSLTIEDITLTEVGDNPIISALRGTTADKPQNKSINELSAILTSNEDGIGLKEANFIKFHDSEIQVLEKLGSDRVLALGPEFLSHYDSFTAILSRYIKLLNYVNHQDGSTSKGYWSNLLYANYITDQVLSSGYTVLNQYMEDLTKILDGKLSPGLLNPTTFSKVKLALGSVNPKPRWSLDTLEELYDYPFYVSKFTANETNFCDECEGTHDLYLIISIPLTVENEFKIFKLKSGKVNVYSEEQNKALEITLKPNKHYVLKSEHKVIQLSEEEFGSKCYKIINRYFCDANIIFYSVDSQSLPDSCLYHMFENDVLEAVKSCNSLTRPVDFAIMQDSLNSYEITSVIPLQITFTHSNDKEHVVEHLAGQYEITLNENVTKATSKYFKVQYESKNLERIEGHVTVDESLPDLYGNHLVDALLEKEIFNYLTTGEGYRHISNPPINLMKKLTEPLYYVSIMAVVIVLSIITFVLKFSIKLMDPQEFLSLWCRSLPCFRLFRKSKRIDQETQTNSYVHGGHTDGYDFNPQRCNLNLNGHRPDIRFQPPAFHDDLTMADRESI